MFAWTRAPARLPAGGLVSPLQGRAVITGIGMSAVGRRLGRSGWDLTVEACRNAIADAGLSPDDIDGVATYPGPNGAGPAAVIGAGNQDGGLPCPTIATPTLHRGAIFATIPMLAA